MNGSLGSSHKPVNSLHTRKLHYFISKKARILLCLSKIECHNIHRKNINSLLSLIHLAVNFLNHFYLNYIHGLKLNGRTQDALN